LAGLGLADRVGAAAVVVVTLERPGSAGCLAVDVSVDGRRRRRLWSSWWL